MPATRHRHFLLHKPLGYLSQFATADAKEAKKHLLGELYDFPAGLMAIGRLDQDSEGLLLLTTDGWVSEQLRGPGIEKEYYAQLDGCPTEAALAQLRTGVDIGIHGTTYRTAPCAVQRLEPAPAVAPRVRRIRDDRHGPTSWVSITLSEGKFRQVRKMTAAVGFPTLRLLRVRVGAWTLGNLVPGAVVEVADLATVSSGSGSAPTPAA